MITAHFVLCIAVLHMSGQDIMQTADLPHLRVDFQGATYQADAQGRITFPTDTPGATATVWAQNHAVRMLNGAFNVAYTQNVGLFPGDICVYDENHAYSVLTRFGKAFDDLRARVPALAGMNFGFPADRRIEVSWYDLFPTLYTFTEPTSSTGYPLIHLKDAAEDTVYHEFCHAVHFSLLPYAVRDAIKVDYLGWIMAHLFDAFHWFTLETSPLVAWVESWGDFCQGRVDGYFLSSSPTFAVSAYGDWYEGIVANVVFFDMVPVWGFATSVTSYIYSQAKSFQDYAAYIQTHPQLSAYYPQLVAAATARGIAFGGGGSGGTSGGGGTGGSGRVQN